MTSRRPSLLLVDDEPTSLLLLNQILEDEHDIRLATSGEQALKLIEQAAPDLILLDMMMPGMDGLSVCHLLKESPATMDIPILFVTKRASADDETRALEAGGADFIHKPISPPVVRARVRAQIALKARNDSLAHAHATLAERARELEALQASKADLTRMVVHDLKNPLTAAMGFVELLCDELRELTPVPHAILESAEEVRSATTRILKMVNALLQIDLAESGRLQTQMRWIDTGALVTSLVRGAEREAALRSLDLRARCEIERKVSADEALLSRTLENFLSNALRYTPRGGRIEAVVRPEGDDVLLAVCNTGQPIDPGLRERIFEKHISTGDPTARGLNLGLGLYFARLATSAQGGRIGVDATPEWPTRFWVRLPLVPRNSMEPRSR
ncbi:MAG: hybrid sensor histidine kinase/response regulator [Polyangiaceae bacterium]